MQGIGPSSLGGAPVMSNVDAQKYYSPAPSQTLVIPRPTITSQIESMNEELASLFSAVDRLGERTQFICDPAQPEGVLGNTAASDGPPIIDALDSIIGRIRLATARLSGLADRVRI